MSMEMGERIGTHHYSFMAALTPKAQSSNVCLFLSPSFSLSPHTTFLRSVFIPCPTSEKPTARGLPQPLAPNSSFYFLSRSRARLQPTRATPRPDHKGNRHHWRPRAGRGPEDSELPTRRSCGLSLDAEGCKRAGSDSLSILPGVSERGLPGSGAREKYLESPHRTPPKIEGLL